MSDNEAALEECKKGILNDLNCPLKDAATNLVFGKGNPNTEILFIGEAPGAKEDLQGIPFVGAAGRELDKFLHEINLSLNDIYIANILKYRPPDNRDPTKEEIARHTPYLIEQIKIIKPKIIIPMGNFATKFVLSDFQVEGMKKIGGITSLHGKPVDKSIDGLNFKVFPLYHPAAILYNPRLREELGNDFKKIPALLN
ncbi:uracil-DNA glycosylase family protein [Nanoarchaeota archaeon]